MPAQNPALSQIIRSTLRGCYGLTGMPALGFPGLKSGDRWVAIVVTSEVTVTPRSYVTCMV
jgi:hypothetical protein